MAVVGCLASRASLYGRVEEQMQSRNESVHVESTGREEPPVVEHDDSLILWMLGLTPAKRLEVLQNFVDGVVTIQHARRIAQ